VFDEIAGAGVVVDMIVQSIGRQGHANISFTVPETDLAKCLKVVTEQAELLGCPPPTSCPQVAKLSVFGVGMKSHTGVAAKRFETLASEGINIDMISTSEIKISVVVDLAMGEQAMKAVHAAFLG
jgi:aspartate kinase